MKIKTMALVAALMIVTTAGAGASAEEEQPPVSGSLSLTANGVFLLPGGEAFGGYLAAGPSLFIPVHGRFSIIPGAQVEVAPVLGNWGFIGNAVFDLALAGWFALDFVVAIIHDVDPLLKQERGKGATAFFAFGGGPTFILPNGMTIGPFALAAVSLEGFGWSVNPGVALGVPLP